MNLDMRELYYYALSGWLRITAEKKPGGYSIRLSPEHNCDKFSLYFFMLENT